MLESIAPEASSNKFLIRGHLFSWKRPPWNTTAVFSVHPQKLSKVVYFFDTFLVYITEWKTLWKMCKTLSCE